jgi:hypothetical protein
VLHVVVNVKFEALVPLMPAPMEVNVAVPLLLRVVVSALDEPSITEPKLSDVGERLVPMPSPRSGISCGLEGSLSFTTRLAAAALLVTGLKVTPTVHVLPAAIVPVQVLLATVKFVFVALTLLNVTEELESFVNVTVWALLVVATT